MTVFVSRRRGSKPFCKFACPLVQRCSQQSAVARLQLAPVRSTVSMRRTPIYVVNLFVILIKIIKFVQTISREYGYPISGRGRGGHHVGKILSTDSQSAKKLGRERLPIHSATTIQKQLPYEREDCATVLAAAVLAGRTRSRPRRTESYYDSFSSQTQDRHTTAEHLHEAGILQAAPTVGGMISTTGGSSRRGLLRVDACGR